MSEITDLDGPELYLVLCRNRISQWERAASGSRTEHEAAEGFTRAFAELDAVLKEGGLLPRDWAGAGHPDMAGSGGGIWPVQELLGGHSVRLEKNTEGGESL
jgi:hypothetical protein